MNSHFLILVYVILVTLAFSTIVSADDDYDDVKEVLEEDQHEQFGEGYYYEDDSNDEYDRQQQERMRQQEEAERLIQEEAERQAQEQADRVAAERERKFEAELAKMNDEQKKAAKKQKKKDARIVRSVLKAAEQGRLYAVLGIQNWNLSVPSKEMNIAGFSFTIPGFTLKQTTAKDIKKAYRSRAMIVHPDKNRDGRAQEAFIAVENAASILTDPHLRAEYDKKAKKMRIERHRASTGVILKSMTKVQAGFAKTFRAARSVLGPFATPVIILGALMI